MKKISTWIVLFSLCSIHLLGQGEGDYWYFGKGLGLDFSKEPSTLLTNGAMQTDEGCASISDAGGNLLFYTDGQKVWNGRHEIMKNGEGLQGHFSATQSAVIIPKPRSRSTYYIFTIDAAENNLVGGLRYTEINMVAEGGLGAVKYKNKPLASPTCEKITAAVNQNGKDFWVIAHGWGNNNFYAFSVTEKGVEEAAVISSAGTKIKGDNAQAGAGYMKASPNGEHIAVTLYNENRVELFNFDNSIGEVTEWLRLPKEIEQAYGVEFSPNSAVLYAGSFATGRIVQYNLGLDSKKAISNSGVEVCKPSNYNMGAIQLAPDGRIYTTSLHYSYLSVIHDPNDLGSRCRYRARYIKIGKNKGRLGLPSFIQTYFNDGANQRRKTWREEEARRRREAAMAKQVPMQTEKMETTTADLPPPTQVCIQVKEKIFNSPDDPNSGVQSLRLLSEATLKMQVGAKVLDYDLKTGETKLQLSPERRYELQARKSGYLSQVGEYKARPGIKLDTVVIVLDRIFPEKEIVLDNIYYDYDRANLRLEAFPELGKLVKVLQDNIEIRIQISAHTDCRGEEEYNESLSQRRAQSVVEYLVGEGIARDRLMAKGYGESLPASDCDCRACTKEDHQRNRRTTFKILK